MNPPCRVVKLGGSLLERNDLPERMTRWLAQQPPALTVLLVGGGRLADVIRDYDQQRGLPSELAHAWAIETMRLNAEFVASWLRPSRMAWDWNQVFRDDDPRSWILLQPLALLRREQGRLKLDLPASWDVTSDSLAAATAEALCAAELVLFKSGLPGSSGPESAGFPRDYVDPYFPRAAARLARVRCVHLADDDFPERDGRLLTQCVHERGIGARF